MSAKTYVVLTFSTLLGIGVIATIFVLSGTQWSGGNEQVQWIFFLLAAIYLFGFIIYRRKAPMAKWAARLTASFDGKTTPEEGLELYRKYSPILLAGVVVFLIGSVTAIFRY